MLESSLKKLVKDYDLEISRDIVYGEIRGYASAIYDGERGKCLHIQTFFESEEDREDFAKSLSKGALQRIYEVKDIDFKKDEIIVTFANKGKAMKKIDLFIKWFYQRLFQADAQGISHCSICRQRFSENGEWKIIDGVPYYLHSSCAELIGKGKISSKASLKKKVKVEDIQPAKVEKKEVKQEVEPEVKPEVKLEVKPEVKPEIKPEMTQEEPVKEKKEKKPKKQKKPHYITGFFGGLIGMLIGTIPWIVVYYFGWFAGWLGLLIGYAIKKGYEFGNGKKGFGKYVIEIFLCILGVVVANLIAECVMWGGAVLQGQLGNSATLKDIPYIIKNMYMTDAEYLRQSIIDMGIGLVFSWLGIIEILKDNADKN